MAQYVDGFILVVPNDKTEEYIKMAEGGRDSWMKHGALGYYECRGNDLTPNEMGGQKTRSFTDMAGANSNESVWFSFIIFKSNHQLIYQLEVLVHFIYKKVLLISYSNGFS